MNDQHEHDPIPQPHPLGYVPLPVWAFLIGALYVAGSKIYAALAKWDVLQILAPFLITAVLLMISALVKRRFRTKAEPEEVQQVEVVRAAPIQHETRVNIIPRHYNTQQETDLFEISYNPETQIFKIKSVKEDNRLESLAWGEVEGRSQEKKILVDRKEKTTLSVSMTPSEAGEIMRKIQEEGIQDIRRVMSLASKGLSPTPLSIQNTEEINLIGG